MSNVRQRKTVDPCPGCGLHRARCICALVPSLTTRTRLSLIIHHRELKRTTNTGQLAVRALTNAGLFVRGRAGEPLDIGAILVPDYRSVLFYPDADAIDIQELDLELPVNLIVPDGNWRQAGKVHRRHPQLAALPRVKLSMKNEGQAHLRAEHFAEGHATLAAIARAFAVLEDQGTGATLDELYRAKLTATLAGRPRRTAYFASSAVST